MEITEAPENTTETAQEIAAQRPSHRHRIRWAILIAVGLLVISIFVVNGIRLNSIAAAERQTAEQFVAQRIQAASQMTHGGIQAEDVVYGWDVSSERVNVKIKLGTCSLVGAYVPITSGSKYPQSYGDTEPLVVVLPAEREDLPDAEVSIDAPNFYMAASSSGLRHCTNGDHRFSDVPPTE